VSGESQLLISLVWSLTEARKVEEAFSQSLKEFDEPAMMALIVRADKMPYWIYAAEEPIHDRHYPVTINTGILLPPIGPIASLTMHS
jgi:hypothetical protein